MGTTMVAVDKVVLNCVESLGAVQRSKSTTEWLSTDVVYSSLRKILETVSRSTSNSEDNSSTHVKHLKVLITACTHRRLVFC